MMSLFNVSSVINALYKLHCFKEVAEGGIRKFRGNVLDCKLRQAAGRRLATRPRRCFGLGKQSRKLFLALKTLTQISQESEFWSHGCQCWRRNQNLSRGGVSRGKMRPKGDICYEIYPYPPTDLPETLSILALQCPKRLQTVTMRHWRAHLHEQCHIGQEKAEMYVGKITIATYEGCNILNEPWVISLLLLLQS